MNMVSRGVIAQSDDEPGMQQIQISLLHDEAKVAVERMQNYGFSSNAPADSEVLCVFIGGGRDHGVIVATDDRATRLTGLGPGEVAIYTDEGDSIVLKRDNTVEVTCKKLVINSEDRIEIKTKELAIEAEDGVKIKADVEIDGNLHSTGDITADGSISGRPRDAGSERMPDG
jgi:phage baseplate assembly protein V